MRAAEVDYWNTLKLVAAVFARRNAGARAPTCGSSPTAPASHNGIFR